jgi:hypothetical protein
MRFWLMCVLICSCVSINAQSLHSLFYTDSIKINHRIGGQLDSIDQIVGVQSTTLPGGGWNLTENILPANFLSKFNGGQRFYDFSDWNQMRFTGLPHIGFAYSFGAKGTQFAKAEYQQVFNNSFLLNVDYIKYKSNGFLRNNDFSHNNIQLQLTKKGKFYSFELKGSYESSDVALNKGLVIDTLANDFSLIYLPVRNENARVKTQRARVLLANYFDLIKDSTKAFGFFTQHELRIKKYVYQENDTLFGIYSMVNFDSLQTYDQHQWSQISNGAGIFLQSTHAFLKTGINAEYWNFQNLGRYRDTTEISLFGDFNYKKRNTLISNQLDFNIIGAKNEFSNYFEIAQRFNSLFVNGSVRLENKLPDYYQRFAIGNNYETNLVNPQKQQRFDAMVKVNRNIGPFDLTLGYNFNVSRNNYLFIENTWRNDTLSLFSFHQFNLRASYRFKALMIQPSYIYTLTDKSFRLIPSHQLQTRLLLKGGIFKAKKLIAYIGVDLALVSSYQRMGFNSSTSTFDLTSISPSKNGFTNLHFFTGFQIDEFKFFVRMENIAYLWNDNNISQQTNYPIPSMQLRVGITWDFFN